MTTKAAGAAVLSLIVQIAVLAMLAVTWYTTEFAVKRVLDNKWRPWLDHKLASRKRRRDAKAALKADRANGGAAFRPSPVIA